MQQKTKEIVCNKCNGEGKPSKAFSNSMVYFDDFGGDAGKRGTTGSRQGKAELIDVLKCENCGRSWVPVNNQGNSRERAMIWWNNLPNNYTGESKGGLADKHGFQNRSSWRDLTGREIEQIWRTENPIESIPDEFINTDFEGDDDISASFKYFEENFPETEFQREMKAVKDNNLEYFTKPNKKQYKEFSPELFKAYIDKFSEEGKEKALDVLLEYFNIGKNFSINTKHLLIKS